MNATMNGSSCSSLINPTAAKIWATIAFCLILVVSLVGNSFIALIVYKTQTLRKPINYFIVNMAMSDILFPMFALPLNLSSMYTDSSLISGPLGQALCKLVPFLLDASIIVSIQSLVLIAVDRFGAVVFPLRSPPISSKLWPFFILATWIVAMAVFSPHLIAKKLVEHEAGQHYCGFQWDFLSMENYFLSIFVVFVYIPLALLVILYSIIVIKLKLQKIPGEQSVNADEQRAKRNRNVLRMAFAIVLGFIFCWVPFSVIRVLILFAPDTLSNCELVLYWNITCFMAYANCVINPFICYIFSGNYRQGLKRLLKCFG